MICLELWSRYNSPTVIMFNSSAFATPSFSRGLNPSTHEPLTNSSRNLSTCKTLTSNLSSTSDWPTVSPREKRVVLKSWQNKTGKMIRQISENIWVIERGYVLFETLDVGGRTTVIKLPSGGLFVHSPLALTKDLKQTVDELGEVSVVVAPNTEHIDFIKQWKTFYPNAKYLAPPTTMERLSDIPFDAELYADNRLDERLQGSGISQFYIPCAPYFNESVFVHKETKTLLVTDLYWAFPKGPDAPLPTRAFGWAMDNVYKPVYERFLVTDRKLFADTMRDVLNSGFDRMIPCHGAILESGGREVLHSFFANMLR